jgi:hypothetical protein
LPDVQEKKDVYSNLVWFSFLHVVWGPIALPTKSKWECLSLSLLAWCWKDLNQWLCKYQSSHMSLHPLWFQGFESKGHLVLWVHPHFGVWIPWFDSS